MHFYDGDKFSECPYCSNGKGLYYNKNTINTEGIHEKNENNTCDNSGQTEIINREDTVEHTVILKQRYI